MTIVIVSHAADDHAAAVAECLAGAGARARLVDTGAFPLKLSLSFGISGTDRSATIGQNEQELDVADINVVWWRRPQPYVLDEAMDPTVACFAYSECHEAMAGMWHSLKARWVNPPAADEIAHHKPYQLAVAQDVGLRVPLTLITNDPDAARGFLSQAGAGRFIYKTFLAHESHWRETRLVTARELRLLDSVRLAPVIFQEFVEAEADLRVTVFGQDIYAAEILTAPGSYEYDYRVDLTAVTMRPASLPEDVERALLDLMQRLGLVYGAIDLRRTPEGQYIFLEINPAGEFLFIEDRCGLPLAAAMAKLLTRLDNRPLQA